MMEVNHIKVKKDMKVNELVKAMKDSGVLQAGKLSLAVDILDEIIKDKECKLFCGIAGALVPGGMKQIIIDMLNDKWIDVLVITGANLTHDLGESLGNKHYQGNENMDDAELRDKGYDRIYNSLMPNKIYINLEKFIKENFSELSKQ